MKVEDPCVVCREGGATVVYTGLRYPKKPTDKTYTMVRCPRCALLYVAPRPETSELAQLYADPSYRASDIAERTRDQFRLEYDSLRCIERYLKKGRVLDVGCGAGHFLHCARQRGWDPIGLEIAPHSVEFARSHYGLSVIDKTVSEAGLPRHSFDLITLIGVIEHASYPVQLLQELRCLLGSGGFIFICTDNSRSWMHWLMGRRFPWIIPPEHLQLFTPASIDALLRAAGFTLLRIDTSETIYPDAAIRGLSAIVGLDGHKVARSVILQRLISLPLIAMYPLRALLWRLALGAQMYVVGRMADGEDSQ